MKRQIVLGLLITLAAAAQAETYTFRNGENDYLGTDDAYIRGSTPTVKNGAGTVVYVRSDNIHGLFKFDLAEFKGLSEPITSAKLTLTDFSGNSGSNKVVMYRLLKPWVEADVTYNEYASGLAWETPGAAGATDRGPALSTNYFLLAGGGQVKFDVPLPMALVQDWIDNPSNNYGVIFTTANSATTALFPSEGTAALTNRPMLTIEAVPKATETFTFRNGVNGYAGTDDLYIRQTSSNTAFGASNPTVIYIRNNTVLNDHIHGLFRFDLSALANKRISRVAEATVTLFDDSTDAVQTNRVDMFRVLKPWVEAQTTYNEYATGSAWELPGAFGATDRGPFLRQVGLRVGTHTNFNISLPTYVVEDWIANPSSNNGFLMDSMDSSTVLLRTSEDTAPHKRPQLTLKVVRLPPLGTMIGVK